MYTVVLPNAIAEAIKAAAPQLIVTSHKSKLQDNTQKVALGIYGERNLLSLITALYYATPVDQESPCLEMVVV
jgi:hypothetical protein